MLNNLVNSSNLKLPKMLCLNGQKQYNPISNFEDKPINIKTDLEEFLNKSQ